MRKTGNKTKMATPQKGAAIATNKPWRFTVLVQPEVKVAASATTQELVLLFGSQGR